MQEAFLLKSLILNKVYFPDDLFEVPTLVYDIYDQEIKETVGRIEYRHETGRDLIYYGNIGYLIYRKFRGNNYAYYACLKLIEILDPKIHEFYLTCNPDNIASKRTIEKLGALHVALVDVESDHELYRHGDIQKEVYIFVRDGDYETYTEDTNQ